jgi:hypothetical protein
MEKVARAIWPFFMVRTSSLIVHFVLPDYGL